MARQGAAGVLQSAWRRSGGRLRALEQRRWEQRQQDEQQPHESIPAPFMRVGGGDSASLAASSMTPTAAGEDHKPSSHTPRLMPRQQLLEGAEAHGAVYAVWGAFTSLLTAAATRGAVHRAVDQGLLAIAAATLSTFNQTCRKAVTTATIPSSAATLPALPSRIRTAVVAPDPASFDCVLSFRRDMDVAVRRMAGARRALVSSLSAVRAAAGRLVDGTGADGAGGGEGGGSDEDLEGVSAGMEAFEAEAASLVSAVAEVRVHLLSRHTTCNVSRPVHVYHGEDPKLEGHDCYTKFTEVIALTLGCRHSGNESSEYATRLPLRNEIFVATLSRRSREQQTCLPQEHKLFSGCSNSTYLTKRSHPKFS